MCKQRTVEEIGPSHSIQCASGLNHRVTFRLMPMKPPHGWMNGNPAHPATQHDRYGSCLNGKSEVGCVELHCSSPLQLRGNTDGHRCPLDQASFLLLVPPALGSGLPKVGQWLERELLHQGSIFASLTSYLTHILSCAMAITGGEPT